MLNIQKELNNFGAKNNNKGNINNFAIHEVKRPYKCQHCACDKGFIIEYNLNKHSSAVHERKRPYRRPNCDASFYQKCNLTTYISTIHK